MKAAKLRWPMIAAVVMILTLGCAAAASQPAPAPLDTVTLRVENTSLCRVTVYRVLYGGTRGLRIGAVEAKDTETFQVAVDDGLLEIGVHPFACRFRPMTTQPIQIRAGSRVRLTIPAYIPGSFSVRMT